MARANLYVLDSLKKRMDKAKRYVNWSKVAQAAFEQKLGELAQQKEIKKMSDVIQRLRASKLESDSDVEKQGRNDGREWAMHTAKAVELERLDSAKANRLQDWDYAFDGETWPGMVFFRFLRAESEEFHHDEPRDFWAAASGDDHARLSDDAAYVAAFADGALQVWSEVSDQL